MELSELANKIFQMKYARLRPNGNKETWEQSCVRIANYVASVEENESDKLQYLADFTKIILERSFIPGGRILANAGTEIKNLGNCFVIPVEDSRQGIYGALQKAAEIFAWGGGIGYNFSKLRYRGSVVKGTGGEASGPISFMSLFDLTGDIISQASRRGAQMDILNVDHPDIEEFINYKSVLNAKNARLLGEYLRNLETVKLDRKGQKYFEILKKTLADDQLSHFNISVAMTDAFMKKPDGHILRMIAENAWKTGDPGLYFIDTSNKYSLVPYLGSLDATDPCGEIPLLPYEMCVLGSINLTAFVEGKYIDFDYLKHVVRTSVRFLDNVQEINETPVEEINKSTKATRRLGLGVMGLADVLEEMDIPYDHEDAFTLSRILAKTIQTTAWEASMDLADNKGPFPAYKPAKINWTLIDNLELKRRPLRNVAVTSIAPTGTIALIADVNSGIEPYFNHNYIRNITLGTGNTPKDSFQYSSKKEGTKTAHEIHWRDHIRMQATWQEFVDNAISKTINMPEDATVDDIEDAYKLAWELGCKGLTVYRNRSRMFQILETDE